MTPHRFLMFLSLPAWLLFVGVTVLSRALRGADPADYWQRAVEDYEVLWKECGR